MSSRERHRARRSRSRSPVEFYKRENSGRHDRYDRGDKYSLREEREQRSRVERQRSSPERKRERTEKNHSQEHIYKKPRDRREERRKHEHQNDQNNQENNIDRETFLGTSEEDPPQPKEEANFELSGKLTEYTNTYKGVVIKYNEPPEAIKPKTRWRLYPFKGDKVMPVLYVHRQSAFLIGRQRHIVDMAVDHPSCSKQHAVLQYRLVNYEREDGVPGRKCKPYIIDLESQNGTFLNNQKIDARRYYELKEKDVLKFGFSSREYVLLHEKSKGVVDDEDLENSPGQTEEEEEGA